MRNKVLEIQKTEAIREEVEASFNFIASGLRSLNEQSSLAANNHVPIQLLSSGFERLVKILLLIKDKHLTGSFPELQKAKTRFVTYNNGHGIEKMLDELIEYATSVEIMQKVPMVIGDLKFIKTDPSFRKFLGIITDFSVQQRYYYIDTIVLEDQNCNTNPFSSFKKFIWNFKDGVDETQQSYEEEEKLKIKNAIICIEKGVRAISRFFTHGFEDLGKMYYNNFSHFILLKDNDLGSLKYPQKKKLPSDHYKPLRTFSLTFLTILLNSKAKIIYAYDYPDWAFKVNFVKVFSFKKRYFFAKIHHEIFALTGETSTRYKIPDYYKSVNLKPRKYAVYLLEEARNLC